MMPRIGKIITCLIVSLCLTEIAMASLSVTVNRTQLSDADVLRLVIKIENASVSGQPNLAALTQDFEVLSMSGPNTETRISITNGQRVNQSSTSWELQLRPRRLGTITIPGFSFGNERSNPIVITVAPQTQAMKQRMDQYVLLETSVNATETYVQSQLIYTVKLFYVENISGNFPVPPVFENAIVETLEDERRYDTIQNGRRYYVLEKSYAIFPQRSGEFSIPRESFTGVRSGNRIFSAREQIGTSSESHEITVLPKPDSYNSGDWLPAKALTITESWNSGVPVFKVGEPVNRVLTLVVDGLPASFIPLLTDIEIDGAKIYEDPAIESQSLNQDGIISTKVITIGIVPTKPGTIVIPEIRIPWWNTTSNTAEVAVIEAQSFEVSGEISPVSQLSLPEENLTQTKQTVLIKPTSPFWKIVAAIATILWLGTTILWWRKPSRKTKDIETKPESRVSDTKLFKSLIKACQDNRGDIVLNKLFRWGKTQYPSIKSNAELAIQSGSSQLKDEVDQLETLLYSKEEAQSWRGQDLAALLTDLEQNKGQASKPAALAVNLNPA